MNDTSRRVAAVLTERLRTGLTHRGNPDTEQPPLSIPLPAFRTTGMPEELTKAIRSTANLVGEAIVHTIEDEGVTLVDTKEFDALRQRADVTDQQPGRSVTVNCRRCQRQIMRLAVQGDTANVDGATLGRINFNCPHTVTG